MRSGSAVSTRASERASAAGPPTSNAACAASAQPAPWPRAARRLDRPRRRLPPVPSAAPRQRGWAERGDGGAAAGGGGALALAGERLLQRADEHAAHEAAIAEAHLGLGRMHVDVDLARI